MTDLTLLVIGMMCIVIASIMVFRSPRGVQGRFPVTEHTAAGGSEGETTLASTVTVASISEAEIQSLYHALAFEVDELDWRVPSSLAHMTRMIGDTVKSCTGDPQFTPRRPSVLPELVHAINDSETPRRTLAQIIAQDPALVANVLKLANSAFYRVGSQPVESVDRAVAVLGVRGMRSVVAAALVQPMFLAGKGPFKAYPRIAWEQSFLAAAAAEAHAGGDASLDPLAAQLLGLVTGLGGIVVFRVALECFRREAIAPHPAVMAAALNAHTAATARSIAAEWQLSAPVLDALDDAAQASSESSSALGRALHFGTVAGTLAVLRRHKMLDDARAKAWFESAATDATDVERIWTRLCAEIKPADSTRLVA